MKLDEKVRLQGNQEARFLEVKNPFDDTDICRWLRPANARCFRSLFQILVKIPKFPKFPDVPG